MTLRLEIFSDETWAVRAADRFHRLVSSAPSQRLCLPTGVTMFPFYREVAAQVELDGVTIFLLDEFGGLPKADPGRCETMLRRSLVDLAQGEPELIVPDVDATDPAGEATRYQREIEEGGLDLAILGLGGNGHVGMNEPGSGRHSPTRVVSLEPGTSLHAQQAYGATVLPTWGLTVGLEQLLAAKEVWLLATGGHKAEILKKTLTAPIGASIPATFLREHPAATVLADESAAALL
ncbi:MAG: glucosamine-6-phosphate deaminase [Acidimicrobiia bacterium]